MNQLEQSLTAPQIQTTGTSSPKQVQQNKSTQQKLLNRLIQLNKIVITDLSTKKGRYQKYQIHLQQLNIIRKQVQLANYTNQNINESQLGDNQKTLQQAIKFLQQNAKFKYLQVRWNMQLAAMKSSINNHQQAYRIAQNIQLRIVNLFQSILLEQQQESRARKLTQKLIKINKSKRQSQIIWIYNSQNNIKQFYFNIRSILFLQTIQSTQQFSPQFMDLDFHISDYMSLQTLQLCSIQKRAQQTTQLQIIRELCIFLSISYFTRATQKYYMKDYSCKSFHFKAIQIALFAFQKECTYVMFLFKVLNDHYGVKLQEIKEQNQDIQGNHQLWKKMPKQTKQVSIKHLVLADQ